MDNKIIGLSKKAANEHTPKCKCFLSSSGTPHQHKCVTNCSHNDSCQKKNGSILNPFENCSTLDHLHQPSFSPSVFKTQQSYSEACPKTPQSFWTIDQIAIMKPVDIDVSQLHQQQDSLRFDQRNEIKAQQAIDDFFASHINMTSPSPHYLAIISPVGFNKRAEQNSLSASFASPNVVDECDAVQSSNKLRQEKSKTTLTTTEVGTQTNLSIPWNVDMERLLKKYSVQVQTNANHTENLATSSLRRKLFFHEKSDETEETDWYPCLSFPEPKGRISSSSPDLKASFHALDDEQPFIAEDLSPHASPIYPMQPAFSPGQAFAGNLRNCSLLHNSPLSNKCVCGGSLANPDVSPILPIEATKTRAQLESTIATNTSHGRSCVDDEDVT